MKLLCSTYNLELNFPENEVQLLRIESSPIFRELTEMLWKQCETGDGEFILSCDNKERRLDKEADIILNPFQIDFNNRKVLAKLYQELKESALGQHLEESLLIENYLEQYVIAICNDLEYPLTYKQNPDIIGYFKLFEVKFDEIDMDTIQRLAQYVKLMHRVLNIQLFIFVNIKDYCSEELLEELYRTLLYEKVGILLLERHESAKIDQERVTIIDKDACLIYDK